MIELNEEQRQAVSQHPNEPLAMVDATTQQTFVLVRTDVFERLQKRSYDDSEFPISEAYPLMDKVLAEAGWDDPAMDVYDVYAPKDNT